MARTRAAAGSKGKGKGGGGGFVGKLPSSRRERLAVCLDALGYGVVPPPAHAVLSAKGEGVRVTLYESGKLLIQGARTDEVVGELQALEVLDGGVGAGTARPTKRAGAGGSSRAKPAGRKDEQEPTDHESEHVLGSDEAGKGDFFGRLVVAACLVPRELRDELRALGVQDSKRLRDPRARSLAREIARRCPHEVLAISPARYNEMYPRFRGLNEMLAWAHGRAIEAVLERGGEADRIVVDQFAKRHSVVASALGPLGKAVKLEQRTKGESEIAVAAASILARARFLDTLDALSERFELKLPKGASRQVEVAGRAFVAKHGPEALGEVAKLHFRTSQRVLGHG